MYHMDISSLHAQIVYVILELLFVRPKSYIHTCTDILSVIKVSFQVTWKSQPSHENFLPSFKEFLIVNYKGSV